MTLEQLVLDLATSQKLRDAGFPQDTAMVWAAYKDADYGEWRVRERNRTSTSGLIGSVAAPTAGELEEWLSVNNLRRFITTYYEPYEPNERRWSVASDLAKKPEPNLSTCRAETLVAALAALVLEVAGCIG